MRNLLRTSAFITLAIVAMIFDVELLEVKG
jgi:hypothetical protein